MKKILFETFLEKLGFLVSTGIAIWAFRKDNVELGFVFWIYACAQLIISEINKK